MKIAKKWKWAAKDADGRVALFVKKPSIRIGAWLSPHFLDEDFRITPFEIDGWWEASLHKRVGDEWVRVEEK